MYKKSVRDEKKPSATCQNCGEITCNNLWLLLLKFDVIVKNVNVYLHYKLLLCATRQTQC